MESDRQSARSGVTLTHVELRELYHNGGARECPVELEVKRVDAWRNSCLSQGRSMQYLGCAESWRRLRPSWGLHQRLMVWTCQY